VRTGGAVAAAVGCALAGFALGRFTAPAASPHAADSPVEGARPDVEDGAPRPAPADVAPDVAGSPGSVAEPAPGLAAGSDRAAAWSAPGTVAARLRQAYREASGGEELPRDFLDEAVRRAQQNVDSIPLASARHWLQRDQLRKRIGELTDPVEIVLQARGRTSISLEGPPQNQPTLAAGPLDVDRAVDRNKPPERWMRGGLVPVGRVLVVEEVEFRCRLGADRSSGEFSANLAGADVLRWSGTDLTLRGRCRGTIHVRPFHESSTSLSVSDAAGELTLRGRLFDAASPLPPPSRMRWVAGSGEGFLERGPVRLQVMAPHGGGNPHSLSLSGVHNAYVRARSERPVWSDTLDPEKFGDLVHAEGAGFVPPGMAFEVRGARWRARLQKGQSHSSFSVTLSGTRLARITGEQQESVEGSWSASANEPVRIRPGQESEVGVTASYHAMAELVVEGDLVSAE
jgi:hypothetical protein